ncbi:MAG: phospho-sugar mutase, partial [Eubacterium sp.]
AVEKGLIEYMGDEVINAFLDEVIKQCVNPDVIRTSGLKVIYTPLNGTGNKPVRKILDRIGIKEVYVVSEQEMPDGNFPTCPFPNPEIKQAFECALKMAEDIQPDLLLATDPDCDRVGIAVKDGNGGYKLMSGNEVGAMMLNYLLSQKKAKGLLSENSIAVKSFVSTDLAEVIANKYNCTFKNLLTGFKYIGELITQLESQGRADDFVMGFEESYGYLAGTHARDKDAVVASMLICEMAAYYKSQGKSLAEVMDEIYNEFGYYFNTVSSYTFEGASGMEKMAAIMDGLRSNTPKSFAGMNITVIDDYKTSVSTNVTDGSTKVIELPKSNVLAYTLTEGNKIIVRPSGTEPKIKAYVTAIGKDKVQAQAIADKLLADADALMK